MSVERNAFDFEGRKVVILGLARQGLALARFFVQAGAQAIISDAASAETLAPEIAKLGDLPVGLVLGSHPLSLLEDCALLCLSGGVPPQLEIVQAAIARGIPLSNDSLLTLQIARSRGLGPLIAITGSSGKTTTTTLVGQMLTASGARVHVGGNIGTPLLDRLDQIQPGEPIVLELSSFQLELFDTQLAWGDLTHIGPDVAAILNITPNHLDRHPDMAAYARAKFNLWRDLPASAQVVLSMDDAVTQRVASDSSSATGPDKAAEALQPLPSAWHLDELIATIHTTVTQQGTTIIPFSRLRPLAHGAWLDGEALVYEGQVICQRSEVLLRGAHNSSNLLAAAAISGAAGADVTAMRQVATSFQGVPHRLEIVATNQEVTWINDSIATAPERAVAALRCFVVGEQTLILLAGGKDKNLPWDSFADEVIERVNYVIGFGNAGSMIVNKVQERAQFMKRRAPSCAVVQRLDEAVALAARVAGIAAPDAPLKEQISKEQLNKEQRNGQHRDKRALLPTVVLLSPGGTSYDAYRDFEARGEHFRRLIEHWHKTDVENEAEPTALTRESAIH